MSVETDIEELVGLPEASDDAVSAAIVGEWIGLTANRVNTLARDGRLMRNADGSFALKDTVRAYCEFTRSTARGRPVADPDLKDAKLKLAREQADKLAIANAKARGDLLHAGRVANEWARVLTDVRAGVLAIPQRIAAECGLSREATAALDREIGAALERIADDG